jgi:DNA invertase Pin-like site-specific DNA recombinase
MAARMGVMVDSRHVYVDNSRSAWKRNRKRPGWDKLLTAIKAGEVKHVLTYHPDRLMRQPWDLEELLRLAEDNSLILHGQANRRDLSNADDRFFLRIEVAHACKSSDDTSRRVKSAQLDALAAGKAHGTTRAYGYTLGMTGLVDHEADIVREVFRRFLNGDAIHAIGVDLNKRGIPSATGVGWSAGRVRQLLDSSRHAGLIMFKGDVQTDESGAYRRGDWPAIVTAGEWEEVKRLREQRSADYRDARRNYRPYLLTGLVLCTGCGRRMVGSIHKGYPCYVCTRRTSSAPNACKRRIGAENLESFISDAAKDLLTNLTVADLAGSSPAHPQADEHAQADDERRLAELMDMWNDGTVTTAEFKAMREPVRKRIAARQRATVVRPTTALDGIAIGPGAADSFDALSYERKQAALRFLFDAVRIDASTARRGVYDYGRITPDPNTTIFIRQ